MAVFPIGEGDEAAERMAAMFGPAQIDQQIRQAIQPGRVGTAHRALI